jgi:hypothetical protein
MKKIKAKKPDEVEKTTGGIRLKSGIKSARSHHADDLAALARNDLKVGDISAVLVHLLQRVSYLEEE